MLQLGLFTLLLPSRNLTVSVTMPKYLNNRTTLWWATTVDHLLRPMLVCWPITRAPASHSLPA